MRCSRTLMALSAAATLAGLGSDARTQSTNGTIDQAIDRYVTATMRSARIPGVALGIVRGERIVYLKGFGRADPSGRPVTPQTPFLIGSITKSFTALAVMQLVDEGRVDLDAPVQRYIPWFRVADPDASSRITVRHLLTMTAGLPQIYETQVWTDQDDRALERTVRFLRTAELTGPVGGSFGYSNANYETLGLIVQTVSGMSYEDYIKLHVFAPLDMRNSFAFQDEARRHGMASGYRWWFGAPVAVTFPDRRAERPAGYLMASAEDMMHYLIAEMNDGRYETRSVLSPRTMALRHTAPAPGKYGLGWEFVRANGRTLINHDGGTANSQASLFFDPDARVGVFVAANVINALDAFASPSGTSPLDGQTTRAMAHVVLNMATNQPLPDQSPGHELLTVIFDLAILVLTIALVWSLVRIPRRHQRLSQRGITGWAALGRHAAAIVVVNWLLPIAVLYLSLDVPAWRALILFEPDLGYWLDGVAAVLFTKGLVELVLAWSVFARTRHVGATRAAMAAPQDAAVVVATRIVVAGGGIGGLAAARHLDRLLGGRQDVEVVLVNRDNFFLLSPLLFEACSGVLELRHCAQPIRPCLRRVRFIEGTVEQIDVERRIVRVAGGGDDVRELAYDHVVVALGATTNLAMIRGSEHARTFKTVADALLLRNHLIEQLERATVEADPRRRERLLTTVVIGGGLVGVELLGELTAFLGDELRYYPQLRRDDLHFHLFEAGDQLLPESKRFVAAYAERVLRRRGAVLHVSTPVSEIEPSLVRWKEGEVSSQTIVLAAGIVPNAVGAATNVSRDRKGRVVTDATLRSVSHRNVWAIGDCASTPSPDGRPYPALAQHAVRAARVVARNIAADVRGETTKPFLYEPLGMMAAFGHTHAACDVRGLKLTGFIAWWMRRTYYLFQMPRWETRIRIAFDWTVSLFYRPDLTKVDLAAEREQERRNGAADGSPPRVASAR